MRKNRGIKLLFMVLVFMYGAVSYAKEPPKVELTFTVTAGGEAIVTGGETGERLIIPKSIGDYPVAGIENDAFRNQTELRSVMIEEGVRYIGARAFDSCTSLQTIRLPEGLQYIGEKAFGKCENLIEIEGLIDEYTHIDDDAFAESGWEERQGMGKFIIRGRKGITAKEGQDEVMEVPYGITHLGPYFAGVISVSPAKWDLGCAEIILPDTIIMMESGVFRGLIIEKINLPSNIEEIPYLAFCDSEVEEILIPEHSMIRKIGESAFERTMIDVNSLISSLDKLEIIEAWAFGKCLNLYSLTLPPSAREISDYTFANCTNLSKVSFEEGLLEISGSTFFGCPLKRLQLPESLKVIKGDTLYLAGLERIYIPAKAEVNENLFSEFMGESLIVYGQSGSDAQKAAVVAGLSFIEVEEGKDMP